MITIFLGPAHLVELVAGAAAAHAEWLGRPLEQQRRSVDGELAAYAAYDPATTDDANRLLAVCQSEAECTFRDDLGDAAARIRVHLHLAEASLRVEVPLGAPVHALHARLPAGGWLLSDDLRLMRRLLRPELDPVGLLGLLKWGAAPAPMTIFDGVGRVVPGTALAYDGRRDQARTEDQWREKAAGLASAERPATADEARALVVGAIDAALAAVPAGSAVHFSAGVDSPLIASRLVASGVDGLRLTHMTFRDAPAETDAARAIAGHLRLPISELAFDAAHGLSLLARAARESPFPVGDTSMIAGDQVLLASLAGGALGVVDGTAGGTADNRRRAWMRASGLPAPVAGTAAWLYRALNLWVGRGGRLESWLRAASRSHGVPLPAAALSQNGLEMVAYALPRPAVRAIAGAIGAQARELPGGPVGREAFAVAAVVHQGAARWAAKAVGPATRQGIPAVLPFLSERVVMAKLRTLHGSWGGTMSKQLLRSQLEQTLPRELVYRPKHAFMSPMDEVLAQPGLRREVAAAIEPGRPLAEFLRPAPVRRLLSLAASGAPIGDKQAGFLWTLAFSDRWLRETDFSADSS